jgi:Protein of unknown function (DUF1579)
MKTTVILCASLLGLAIGAAGQMEMPKPAPELKKLDVFVGSWTLNGDMKPGPMGPGGKLVETEKCEWMEGGFYVVCHADYKMETMGNGKAISVLGYSPDERMYTYREFSSDGEFTDARGTLENNTWTWSSEEKMGGAMTKGRFTMKMTSATSYDFMFEMSQDGAKWTNIMDGKATKPK